MQPWTAGFAQRISRDIANRDLPLLVDAGGQVSDETHQILAQCTGAILIAATAKASELEEWRALVADQALPLKLFTRINPRRQTRLRISS